MKRLVLAPVAVLVVLVATAAATAQPPIAQKQAQADSVLAQINAIDVRLGHTVDAYDGAREQLAAARRSIATNHAAIRVSRRNLKLAQQRLASRLVALYTSDQPTEADVLLGSTSLSNLVDRLNAAHEIGARDRGIARSAASLQQRLDRQRLALAKAAATRRSTVARLASQRAQVEGELAHRQRLLASIKGKIAQLRAQERAREQLVAAQARARIARELAARRTAAQAAAVQDAPAPAPAADPAAATPAPADAPAASIASPPPVSLPAAAPSGGHPEAASVAARYLGIPYRWGGASPSGFDCSGFVMYVYAQLGISLPHYAVAQYALGSAVSRDELQPGDLVFFDGLGHVGIYIGGGQFIHSPHTGDVVKVSSLSESWYASTYVGARRIQG